MADSSYLNTVLIGKAIHIWPGIFRTIGRILIGRDVTIDFLYGMAARPRDEA